MQSTSTEKLQHGIDFTSWRDVTWYCGTWERMSDRIN